jgi:hypothetical protein
MRDRRARKPSRAELRAMGLTPGLMARRYTPDGRARLKQLTPEARERRQQFARRLANDTADSEEA